jgi:hypothetical protein
MFVLKSNDACMMPKRQLIPWLMRTCADPMADPKIHEACDHMMLVSCLPLNSIQQLLIKTGIFDPPTLSSANLNPVSALLGLAG